VNRRSVSPISALHRASIAKVADSPMQNLCASSALAVHMKHGRGSHRSPESDALWGGGGKGRWVVQFRRMGFGILPMFHRQAHPVLASSDFDVYAGNCDLNWPGLG